MSTHLPPLAFRLTKTGGEEPNPLTFTAKAGSAARNIAAGSTLVTIRTDSGLGSYLVTADSANASQVAAGIAQALSAKSVLSEAPDLSEAGAIAQLTFLRGSSSAVTTQAGAEISTVVEAIATQLRVGEWVAVSLRGVGPFETRWHSKWMEARTSGIQHHSRGMNVVIMSMWAGGDNKDSARSILRRVTASIPGFDLRTGESVVHRFGSAARALTVTAVTLGLGIAVAQLPMPIIDVDLRTQLSIGLYIAAGLGALTTGLLFTGHLPSHATRIRRRLAQGLVPTPSRRIRPPKPPKKAAKAEDGTDIAAKEGDYPLASTSFLVGSHLPLSIIAPHGGAESGAAVTRERPVPPVFRNPIGPVIGYNDGRPVCLSTADAWAGTMLVGQAGSGKSDSVQAIWGYAIADKMRPNGLRGSAGSQHTMIGLDTKGDGQTAAEYEAWAAAYGAPVIVFDVADMTSNIGIQLFGTEGSARSRARDITNALVYVYGETSIGPESFDTLNKLLTAALVVTPDIASQVDRVDANMSPYYYANILLGNRGDELGVGLAAAIVEKAVRENVAAGSDLADAVEDLQPAYDRVRTVAQRAALLKAPRTKVAAMMAAETWWSRPQQASWQQLIEGHFTIIINTGTARSGDTIDAALAAQLASLIMYSLREAMERHCRGWQAAGRAITVYADELKQVAGTSGEVITWIRNDGRASGVRAVFATQYPEQLSPDVQQAVMGFGTFITFAQMNPDLCATIVKNLAVDQSTWTTADVAQLPRFTAIVRSVFEQSAQTAFTVAVPNFREMRGAEFAALNHINLKD